MLTIHFANRYETLAGLVVEHLGAGDVFAADTVIVPSAALRRDLTLRTARTHGICANVQFGYLAHWLWQIIARVVPGVQAESPFAADVLAWRILAAFDDRAWWGEHPRLRDYLERADAVTRYELALQLAGLFDQYITYRSDWLEAWAAGKSALLGSGNAAAQADEAWQAALWRRLAADLEAAHPAAAFIAALEARGAALLEAGALPAVAHVFCLPAMPPMHLALLQALARCTDVHLYALNPCREFWFEVVDRRRLAYLTARRQAAYHEEGHRLLAAWGRQTQSQLGQLVDTCSDSALDDARFDEPDGSTLLAALQGSILNLTDLAPGSLTLADDDRSVEVHVCHSLARELEVLHDRLLGLFAADTTLRPADILVVTPDLDAAAPLVDAIFGTAPPERRIPLTVTGRARSRVNAVARVLLELLALAGSRFTATAVFGLLQQPLVARRFGIDTAGLARVHAWLEDAGIHWALDAQHRASFALPAQARYTFDDGLARLFLGYALPAQMSAPFEGRLPAGDAEGSDALALGAMWRFVDALAVLHREAMAPRDALAWPAWLAGVLGRFAAADDAELDDLNEVRAAIEAFGENLRRSGIAQALPFEVVRSALARALDDPARGGVPTGAVTFAAISSLRNLPYKVICAVGLSDGSFPSAMRPSEFDLMAQSPRRGDRQRRIDERNLFFDLLLAARGCVHLSYVGRSVRDNAPRPPSVLVSELLEYLLPAMAGDAAVARARLVVEHPLQAFSENAFSTASDPRLRSFDREYADALRKKLWAQGDATPASAPGDDAGIEDTEDERANESAQPFFRAPLAAPGDEWRQVSIDQLQQFFRNPCRFLLRRRLGLELARDAEELQDDEPFLPAFPARSALAARLLPALLAGADIAAVRSLALAGPELPAGAFGSDVLERELAALQGFAAQLSELTSEPVLPPLSVALAFDIDGRPWKLHASFADLRASGLIRHRFDKARAGDHVSAWLQHLLLCAAAPPGVALRTTVLARDSCFVLQPCANPQAALIELLKLYEFGLAGPLYFFPKTAWAYMMEGERASAALGTWRATAQHPFGEEADPAYRLALRGLPDPMGGGFDDFAACAQAVLGPLLECLVDVAQR
jgi:exodeoxyribonuclease V gamma subunit